MEIGLTGLRGDGGGGTAVSVGGVAGETGLDLEGVRGGVAQRGVGEDRGDVSVGRVAGICAQLHPVSLHSWRVGCPGQVNGLSGRIAGRERSRRRRNCKTGSEIASNLQLRIDNSKLTCAERGTRSRIRIDSSATCLECDVIRASGLQTSEDDLSGRVRYCL